MYSRQGPFDIPNLAHALSFANRVIVWLLIRRRRASFLGPRRVALRVGPELGAGTSEGIVLGVGGSGGSRGGSDLRFNEEEVAGDGELRDQ